MRKQVVDLSFLKIDGVLDTFLSERIKIEVDFSDSIHQSLFFQL